MIEETVPSALPTEPEDPPAEEYWDADLIVVIPGLPENLSRPEGEASLFPSSTVEFVKKLRAAGFPIEVAVPREEQTLVAHMAAEVWLPFLNIGAAVFAGAAGNLLASMIEGAFKKTDRSTVAHIDWRVKTKKGTTRRFKYDGPVKGAKSAARSFEKSLRDEDE